MKKIIKLVSLILALIMIVATFAACGKTGDDDSKKPAGTTPLPSEDGDKVPDLEVIDWDGKEYRILGKDHSQHDIFTSFEVSSSIDVSSSTAL